MEIKQVNNIKLNFILATARTGSTLLSSMLNAHPNVISTSEETFTYSLYPKYKNIKNWTSETIQEFCYDFYLFSEGKFEMQFGTKKDLETILEAHKSNLTYETAIKLTHLCFFPDKNKSEINTIVDKHLVFHFVLEKVAHIYPESKFVILFRDPRDNALVKQRRRKKLNKPLLDYYRISCTWKYIYGKLIRLKNKIGSDRFLEVKYEDLVLNPEIELKKISSFLNVPYNEEMLNYDEQIKNEMIQNKEKLSEHTKNLISLLHDGLSQKVYTDKIDIWKQELKKEEADLIWTVCGNLAEEIGYKRDEHFTAQPKKMKNYLTDIVIFANRTLITLYYSSPFFIKYLIKKIKYGKKFKSDDYTSEEYYKRTYHNN